MNAEVLAVGTELLMGQIANTNAQYLSRRLNDLGIKVYYHSVVGDNPNRLKDSLALALS
ncbi:MAG: molybdopterin-binding protein, partial [Clostridia bacterium]|nr:molybdopterin-binding protein [Clostridia bacterium]